jgi:predicted  nucleic acid-binding Zn-ribbon protein
MNELLQNLVRLQSLEFGDVKVENAEASAAKLRAKIPQPILSHYDRLIARGKRGMAMVRDQVCTGCHMRLPMAVIMTLMHDRDIQLCDSCGRYLYLAARAAPDAAEPAKPPKPAKKARKRKASLHPA